MSLYILKVVEVLLGAVLKVFEVPEVMCSVCWRCLRMGSVCCRCCEVLEVPDVIRCVLLCMSEAVESRLCSLEVL